MYIKQGLLHCMGKFAFVWPFFFFPGFGIYGREFWLRKQGGSIWGH